MKKGKIILAALLAAAVSCGLSACGIHAFGFMQDDVKEDTISLESVSEMQIDMTSADIKILRGEENALHYVMSESLVPEISQNSGKLTVIQPKHTGIKFGSSTKNRVEITLDQKTIDTLDISLTSGDIEIDGFSIDGSISTTSGDICVKNAEEGGVLELEATSGDITLKDSSFRRITKDQSSGETEMDHVTADSISFEATSGDLTVRSSKIGDAEIECTSGDIQLELIGSEEDYSYECACTSGSVEIGETKAGKKLQKKNGGPHSFKAETTSGDITVTFISE
ncbi:MAG: DUF4097 family beta strand repeat protein [Oscillospiraceae bacterium]|nr:DUF4097 family beta strand repeat protein [Oscillospiraceae bacterium]